MRYSGVVRAASLLTDGSEKADGCGAAGEDREVARHRFRQLDAADGGAAVTLDQDGSRTREHVLAHRTELAGRAVETAPVISAAAIGILVGVGVP